MKLYRKIMILIIVVVFSSIITFLPFVTTSIQNSIQYEHENNIRNIGRVVSSSPFIREKLENKDMNGEIATYIESVYQEVNEIEFIVVADMEGRRYSHPNPEQVGEFFVGGDQIRVIETGETYLSEGFGTLGQSLRVFVPIYNIKESKQIGFVSVGSLTKSIKTSKLEALSNMIFVTLLAVFIGSVGAVILTRNIKKSLMNLEPDEIIKLYNEKDGMLKAIHEGIVAYDKDLNINMINESALKILFSNKDVKEMDLVGKPIHDVFDNLKINDIFNMEETIFNQELIVNNTVIVANRVLLKNKEDVMGAIITFRDRSEITRLAEEITGVHLIVDALRANTHEFMNKLHVILGFVQMGELEEAKSYIMKISDEQEMASIKYMKGIKDTTIVALLIGKMSRAKELGIDFSIDSKSVLAPASKRKITTRSLVTIIGNLIENAFDAVNVSTNDMRLVSFKLSDEEYDIKIMVNDSGVGITEENQTLIFERGYSTKENSKGIGLDTVKKIVNILNGEILCDSEVNEGTYMTVILPKTNDELKI